MKPFVPGAVVTEWVEQVAASTDQALTHAFRQALQAEKERPRSRIHAFHRYFGKLIPAIPGAAMRFFRPPIRAAAAESAQPPVVLDPFCGSGTTLVEARLAGWDAIGIDLNPLACLVSRAKSGDYDPTALAVELSWITAGVQSDQRRVAESEIPYCVNLEHWFRPEVVTELVRLRRHVERASPALRPFFQGAFSAIIRDVSNADPRHVFPGYSKRMRALDAAGRAIDVVHTFASKTRRTVSAYAQFRAAWPGPTSVRIFAQPFDTALPGVPTTQANPSPAVAADSVDLVVTNPPYISSIRYLETMKLEMSWLGMLPNQAAYLALDRQVTGTERFYKHEYKQWEKTGIKPVDELSQSLYQMGHGKMARVVSAYFRSMHACLLGVSQALKPGGHAVIKISDSFVRGQTIPTHALLCYQAAEHGLTTLAVFPDPIVNRSLLPKRNHYSGLIEHDWILVLRKEPRNAN